MRESQSPGAALSGHDLTGSSCFEAYLRNRRGEHVRVLVTKVVYVGSLGVRQRVHVPISPCDRFGPGGELVTPGDLTVERGGTSLFVVGRVRATEEGARALVRVGAVTRRLVAFGPRRWTRKDGRFVAEPVGPCRDVSLDFSDAFGGPACPENPLGKGFVQAGEDPEGVFLPELEDEAALIQSPWDRRSPAAIGAIAPAWAPRASWSGTYDETWRRARAPALPEDCDARFFDPGSLVARPALRGGEPIEIVGVGTVDTYRAVVPRILFRCRVGDETVVPSLDTLVIDPARDHLTLSLRFVLPLASSRIAAPTWVLSELAHTPRGLRS